MDYEEDFESEAKSVSKEDAMVAKMKHLSDKYNVLSEEAKLLLRKKTDEINSCILS